MECGLLDSGDGGEHDGIGLVEISNARAMQNNFSVATVPADRVQSWLFDPYFTKTVNAQSRVIRIRNFPCYFSISWYDSSTKLWK